MALEQGDPIPDVTLTLPDGGPLRLRNFIGAPFVLYFYPKDDTTGCTREAQEFSARLDAFREAGAVLLGVSKDSPARHRKFIEKYGLTVPLASDEEGVALAAFGTWIEKSMYGRNYMGIDRSTFLFDAEGKLVRAWRKVRVPGHVDEVIEAVRALGT
ncbi:MAG TPA: peroxiredoxin [Sphingomonas sp.]|nr:peroxiredoxin [Sphingomonas sp.]